MNEYASGGKISYLREQVGHKLCRDGFPPGCFPVRPCVAKIRENGGNIAGGGPFRCVYHDQQFHEVVVGWRTGGLDEENVAPTNGLFQLDVSFPIRKILYLDVSELYAEIVSYLLSQCLSKEWESSH